MCPPAPIAQWPRLRAATGHSCEWGLGGCVRVRACVLALQSPDKNYEGLLGLGLGLGLGVLLGYGPLCGFRLLPSTTRALGSGLANLVLRFPKTLVWGRDGVETEP
ncbi:hypothetical protein NL676_000233 [Syzygium grande]|nr:hypothetical protein NL676_000233 [Syzygium grande]